MEGRRHSVDIPISRTLIALRRVKSLRDPSTNSLSKFSPLVDSLNWDREITVGLENEQKGAKNLELEDTWLEGLNKQHAKFQDLCCNSRESHSKRVLHDNKDNHVEGSKLGKQNQDMIHGNKSMSEIYYSNYGDKGLELACVTPSSDYLEGEGSCNEPNEGSMKEQTMRRNVSRPKWQQIYQTETSKGSPCWPLNDDLLGGLSLTPSIYGNEDADILDSSQCGCGIGWSRTPRHREESSRLLGMEEQPLLAESSGQTLLKAKRSCKRANYGVDLYSESPRSLSQKFRPKSFNDLVGQNVVSMSLLSAVSVGKVTPFYLFHGPRGTGKTSASRIFAAALNCLSSGREKPCNHCRQCDLVFSGRSRDFKELHALEINSTQRIRAVVKNAKRSPISSRFKVFIIDECHLLREDTWAGFLNCLEDISGRIVFIMITPDIHKLPRLALSMSQKYHFPKIKEADISNRLEKICMEEGFNFDRDALDFVASKSAGSLRDAEMMLEQLSLVGKEITVSLARDLVSVGLCYFILGVFSDTTPNLLARHHSDIRPSKCHIRLRESRISTQMGVVSDGELLDLLHLAMSADTAETVKRARALMRSRIDPLQLITQLADLIMDILAGNCPQENSVVSRRLIQNCTSEAEMQQLSGALKILSETEKQLRQSKNQTTWLTVALLQLSSLGSSCFSHESRLCSDHMQYREGDFCRTSSTNESVKHLVPCTCDVNASCKLTMPDCQQNLDSVWSKAASTCESRSLQNFLHKRGKLLSISHSQGLAITVLGFHHPKYMEKAEKSWKMITSALQHVLGQNVELRIQLLVGASSPTDHTKLRKQSLNLFSCLHRIGRRSHREAGSRSDTSGQVSTTDKYVETYSSDHGSQSSHACCNVIKALRNRDGNVLSIRGGTPHCLLTDGTVKGNQSGADNCKGQTKCGCQDLCSLEPDKQPGCFFRTLKLEKFRSSETNAQNNLALSVAHTASSQAFF